MGVRDRLAHAWSVFRNPGDELTSNQTFQDYGPSYSRRPDRFRTTVSNERSIVSAIYTRLGIDIASVQIRHVRRDKTGRYMETMKSGLNDCLNVEANIDQAGSAFRQDMAMTLFDKGVIAIVAVETDLNPAVTGGYDIRQLRVGEVVSWYPEHVKVAVYNQKTGRKEEIIQPKKNVAIIENPLYSVMNEPNSTLQRIIRKLNLLDAVDEAAGSGKLDLIIQLPYVVKGETKRAQAETRRSDIEAQLRGSKYGIAYTDGVERITQLNRPAENNMLKQIEYLMNQLFGQLGLAESIFDGTADEATMINYHNRTIEPVLRAITEGLHRTFLTRTARSQGQAIDFSRDPFKLVAISQIAEIADKFTRNEILSSNEVRAIIGFQPVDDAKADQLVNKNLPQAIDEVPSIDPSSEPAPAEIAAPITLKQITP